MSSVAKTIRIITLPHGEAPEGVRRGWIGCEMPCEPECGHVPKEAGGVLTGPSHEEIAGFSVHQDVALDVLQRQAPEAAAWFRERGFPRNGESFRFRREEAEVTETCDISKVQGTWVYDNMETGRWQPQFYLPPRRS